MYQVSDARGNAVASVHRQQVPAQVVHRLNVPASGQVRRPDCPVLYIDSAAQPLRIRQKALVVGFVFN